MKKLLYIASVLVLVLSSVSCKKGNETIDEGDKPVTGFRVTGGFNEWNPSIGCIAMSPVEGHRNWYHADGVAIGTERGDGIKILTADTEGDFWYGNVGSKDDAKQESNLLLPVAEPGVDNPFYVKTAGSYDVYYCPEREDGLQVVLTPAGTPAVKNIHLVLEYLDNAKCNPAEISVWIWGKNEQGTAWSDADGVYYDNPPLPTATTTVGKVTYQTIEFPLWEDGCVNLWKGGEFMMRDRRKHDDRWWEKISDDDHVITIGTSNDYYFHVGRGQFAKIGNPEAEMTSFITAVGFFNDEDPAGIKGTVEGNYVVFKHLNSVSGKQRFVIQDKPGLAGQVLGYSDDSGSATVGAVYAKPFSRWQNDNGKAWKDGNAIYVSDLDTSGSAYYDIYVDPSTNHIFVMPEGDTPVE